MLFHVVFETSIFARLRQDFAVQAEADLAVALFQILREELLDAVRKNLLKKPVLVGVITPYREQVTCIKQTLASILGPELAKEVISAPLPPPKDSGLIRHM